jgi:ankyrin repeat protein
MRTQPIGSAAKDFLEDLIASIERDDKLGVMAALSKGLPVDVMDSNGNTMLMQAAKGGKVKVTTYLLETGADPNILAENGATALMLAVNGCHASTVDVLLKMNADPNLRGPGLPSALTFAAAQDNVAVLQSLIKAGAKLNALDQKGYNALEFSFLNKKAAALRFLRPLYRANASRYDLAPSKLTNAIKSKDIDAMIQVLALGFDPNRPIAGKLPIELAKQNRFEKGEAILIHAGAKAPTGETVAKR